MHGLGNDFIVLNGMEQQLNLSHAQLRLLADRRLGVGCDQVLLLEKPDMPGCDIRYRIFNADGNEVEHCGNGVRCVGDYLFQRGLVTGDEIHAQTVNGRVVVYRANNGLIRVNMGIPRFDPAEIPANFARQDKHYTISLPEGDVSVMAVSVGNPHAVLIVDDVDQVPVQTLGPAIQSSGVFPNGVNVGFMQILDRTRIRLRVFERGVGETLACGTGAVAAMVTGKVVDLLENEVDIGLKGGHLTVSWYGANEPVWMTGPATTVYEGIIDL